MLSSYSELDRPSGVRSGSYLGGGTMLDRKRFRDSVAYLFDNPRMRRVRVLEKYNTNVSIFVTRVSCLLLNERRFLIAVVPSVADEMPSEMPLSQLEWISFQTRTLEDENWMEDIPVHSYNLKRGDVFSKWVLLLWEPRQASKGGEAESSSDFVMKDFQWFSFQETLMFSLLHKRKGVQEYGTRGTIVGALETYQCTCRFLPHEDVAAGRTAAS